MYVAGIDCGTQSTKLVVYDPQARTIVARSQAPHDLIAEDDGTREQKAAWWIEALETCFASVAANLKQGIVAIGVSGQQHGFVPLSRDGEVLYNVKLWNDTSTVEECAEIHARMGGEERTAAVAGNPILPGYTAPKVLWLKNRRPDAYAALSTILLPHDYLNFYLTGRRLMEHGDASGTGFLNVRERSWCQEILRAVDSEREMVELLPPLIEAHAPAGTVSAEAADRLGLARGTVVSSGGGDNMMGAIGTGAVKNGAITVSLGTSGTLFGFADSPILPKGTEFAAFCSSSGGWLPLVCTMNCTSSTELVRHLLGVDLEAFDAVLASADLGAGGIVALPFFDGERTPNLPRGKAALLGMSSSNFNNENLLRAVVEATVFGLRTGLDDMKEAGIESSEIHVVGGGSKSRQWLQIVADVFNARVTVPSQEEAAAFGAALQALWCFEVGHGDDVTMERVADEHVQFDAGREVIPVAENVKVYEQVFADYLEKLACLAPLYR